MDLWSTLAKVIKHQLLLFVGPSFYVLEMIPKIIYMYLILLCEKCCRECFLVILPSRKSHATLNSFLILFYFLQVRLSSTSVKYKFPEQAQVHLHRRHPFLPWPDKKIQQRFENFSWVVHTTSPCWKNAILRCLKHFSVEALVCFYFFFHVLEIIDLFWYFSGVVILWFSVSHHYKK